MAPSIISDTALPADIPESNQTPTSTTSTDKLFGLSDRTVIVTGGARGLGITLAIAILECGGDVVCLDILPEPSPEEWTVLAKLAKTSRTGQHSSYRQCDITSEEAVEEVVGEVAKEAAERGRPVRGLVSCAGIQQMKDAIDYPVEGYRKIFDVNVVGNFIVAKHCARVMREGGVGGSIVFIGSMSGQIANRGLHCSAYNSSKAAVQQMTRSLSMEWGTYGIRVNSLSPGYIRTKMTDQLLDEKPDVERIWMQGAALGRLGAPEDFKAPAVYLLADGSAWQTGSDLRVDGGHCASA
ncbi:NAD(P)-binding protein [Saccharata proteae CBS 121410]|uniref:NAD(P)-binding protein n=1 Tax=Saccharata proteae CBS 121410 TaxID=1314787 RepID=A0A9P4LZF2_9PEZI|nr:NAD(P)-binding protein [Saccharata proteae CBS 121410]